MSDEPKLTLDGKEYAMASLSEQARNQLRMVQVTEVEIQRLQAQLAIAQTARSAYVEALKGSLPN